MKRLICFDLDGTLTQHRSKLEEKNQKVLDKLRKKYKLLMVGAGGAERIYAQMNEYTINKHLLTERSIEFTDNGQKVDVIIPSQYANKFTEFIVERKKI